MADKYGFSKAGLVGEGLTKTIDFIKEKMKNGAFKELSTEFIDKLANLEGIGIDEDGKIVIDDATRVDSLTDSYEQIEKAFKQTATKARGKGKGKERTATIAEAKKTIDVLLNEEKVHEELISRGVDLSKFTEAIESKISDSEAKTAKYETELKTFNDLEDFIIGSDPVLEHKESNDTIEKYEKIGEVLNDIYLAREELDDLGFDDEVQKRELNEEIIQKEAEYGNLLKELVKGKEIAGLPTFDQLKKLKTNAKTSVNTMVKALAKTKIDTARKDVDNKFKTDFDAKLTTPLADKDKEEARAKIETEIKSMLAGKDLNISNLNVILRKVRDQQTRLENQLEDEENFRKESKELIEDYKADIEKHIELEGKLKASATAGVMEYTDDEKKKVEEEEAQSLYSKSKADKIKEEESRVTALVASLSKKEKYDILKQTTVGSGPISGWFKRFIMRINTNGQWKKFESAYLTDQKAKATDKINKEIDNKVKARAAVDQRDLEVGGKLQEIAEQTDRRYRTSAETRNHTIAALIQANNDGLTPAEVELRKKTIVRNEDRAGVNAAANATLEYYKNLRAGKTLTDEERKGIINTAVKNASAEQHKRDPKPAKVFKDDEESR